MVEAPSNVTESVDILWGCISFIFLLLALLAYVWKDDRRKLDGKAEKEDLHEIKRDVKDMKSETKSDLVRIWEQFESLNNYLRGGK